MTARIGVARLGIMAVLVAALLSAGAAGEPIRFVLEATSATATCCQLHVWFGDGFGWPTGLEMKECDTPWSSGPRSPATSAT